MSKLKKIIIAIIFIIMICLIIYFSKDFIIRQYFIAKIQNVDYDEYILTTSYNGKKKEIAYYTEDTCYMRRYDDNEKLENFIMIYDYSKGIQYQYNTETMECILKNENGKRRPLHINDDYFVNFLKYTNRNVKLSYKGVEKLNNNYCHIIEIEEENDISIKFYLDKRMFYIVREDSYKPVNINDMCNKSKHIHTITDYTIDFNLREKYLFETIIGTD